MNFTHIKYGLALAMIAILFGGSMGLGFGCCEDSFKDTFKENTAAVLTEKYKGDQSLADKVAKKSWVYMKRAHLHAQTMGVISIVFSLVAAGLIFPAKLQIGISILSGFGSLGYGFFWLIAGFLAPGMGSTGAAKESIGLLAQVSAASFYIAAVALFITLGYRIFTQKISDSQGH
ncbi:MAG: hypothetical protein ACI8PD_000445 [Nitrospinales bacterium]|jgi:hypothetical protein